MRRLRSEGFRRPQYSRSQNASTCARGKTGILRSGARLGIVQSNIQEVRCKNRGLRSISSPLLIRAGGSVAQSPSMTDSRPKEDDNVTQEVPSNSSRTTKKTHLVLFVNGLNGNDDNWSVVIANLRKHAAVNDIAILASTANVRLQASTKELTFLFQHAQFVLCRLSLLCLCCLLGNSPPF